MRDQCGVKTYATPEEDDVRHNFFELYKRCPIPDDQILSNLGLFLNSKTLARILFLHHIYTKIIDVQGIVIDFGTRWGQNLSLFAALRGIYEPFNRHRKIVGFDTFSGFPCVSEQDGLSDLMKVGNISVTKDYVDYLTKLVELQEADNPLSHLRKFEIVKGDATAEIANYLERRQETIIALAYFDFDLYEPTKKCLEAIRSRLVQGSVLAFDELNDPDSPGETIALMEVFGLNRIKLKRYPYASRVSYFVVE
jgi:hypothetical protein